MTLEGLAFFVSIVIASLCAGIITTPLVDNRPGLCAVLQVVGGVTFISGLAFYAINTI